jgi:hypothetical protein
VPAPDPLAALFHSARGSDVTMTSVRGEILYSGGSVIPFDVNVLKQQMQNVSERLHEARTGSTR